MKYISLLAAFIFITNGIFAQSNWNPLGPVGSPTTSPANGTGRLHAIAFHPTDTNLFYIGTAYGGLWKTIDGGTTWGNSTVNLDKQIPVTGIGEIVIDKNNPNTMYVTTGENDDLLSNPSVGIYKSTNGGSNWSSTSLNFTYLNNHHICKMVMDPDNSTTLFAATSERVY